MSFLKVFFSFLPLLFLFPFPADSTDIIYFASVEEKIHNGKTDSLILYMNPVRKALTNSKFKIYNWNMIIDSNTDQDKLIEYSVKIFLLKNGKLSIESNSTKKNFDFDDTVIAYFEGYFKNNIEIIKVEKIANSTKKKIYFKGLFAPLSYPDTWSRIILRDKLKSDFNYFISFF
ncbi:MAG: hypothetical protein H6680_02565 [Desulfobacteraceae bacterium]|nr:hypothetical protein [Desulfobacteraceae bacterium]